MLNNYIYLGREVTLKEANFSAQIIIKEVIKDQTYSLPKKKEVRLIETIFPDFLISMIFFRSKVCKTLDKLVLGMEVACRILA